MAALGDSMLFVLYVTLTSLSSYSSTLGITMPSLGQVYVLNSGQSVQLDCEFFSEGFHLFDNPVVWKKTQRDEETQINILGNIFEPYLATARYEVSFTSDAPRYHFTLSLSNAHLEDSGNYTCEVRGRKSSLLAKVTHCLFIRAAVEDISLSSDNATYRSYRAPEVISFVEGIPRSLGCMCRGGYPPPQMTVYLGHSDITDQFSLSYNASVDGVKGLRLIKYQLIQWTSEMKLKASDDGTELRCLVMVPGLAPRFASAVVSVHLKLLRLCGRADGPIISCDEGVAFLHEVNVNLVCEVKARPGVSSLFWVVDQNGTKFTESAIPVNEYWSLVMERADGILETRLLIKRATAASFRTYSVVAENSVSMTTQRVQLTRHRSEPTTDASHLARKVAERKSEVLRKNAPDSDRNHGRMKSRIYDTWSYMISRGIAHNWSNGIGWLSLLAASVLTILIIVSPASTDEY